MAGDAFSRTCASRRRGSGSTEWSTVRPLRTCAMCAREGLQTRELPGHRQNAPAFRRAHQLHAIDAGHEGWGGGGAARLVAAEDVGNAAFDHGGVLRLRLEESKGREEG